MTGKPVSAPCWAYTYSYDLPVLTLSAGGGGSSSTGSAHKNFQQTWQLPGPQEVGLGEPVTINYRYQGSIHNETWFIIAKDGSGTRKPTADAKNSRGVPVKSNERYVALTYCSHMFNWMNAGAIVWVRPGVVLTKREEEEIGAAYARLGFGNSWAYNNTAVPGIRGEDAFCSTPHDRWSRRCGGEEGTRTQQRISGSLIGGSVYNAESSSVEQVQDLAEEALYF